MKKLISFAVTFCLTIGGITAFALSPANNIFTDVNMEGISYYQDGISFLKDKGVISGYEDGSFKPYKSINRAEFLKILELTFPGEGGFQLYKAKKCFSDIDPRAWYTEYICYAKENGVISGYPDGTFKPEQTINLVEALKITLKAAGYKYATTTPWYKGVVDAASGANLIPPTFEKFAQEVTRGEMAELATRTFKLEIGVSELQTYLEKISAIYNKPESEIRVTYETLEKNQSPAQSSYCTDNPTVTDAGSTVYPIDPKYSQLGRLGELFTADDCGATEMGAPRSWYIFGVQGFSQEKPYYTLGSKIWLKDAPSTNFLTTLQEVGYLCDESGQDSKCKTWKLDSDKVLLDEILKLKPFSDEIASDDCVNCG